MATTLKAATPLKEKNSPRLVVVVVANFVAFTAFVRGSALIGDDPYATLKAIIDLLPAGLGLVLMSVANGDCARCRTPLICTRFARSTPIQGPSV